MKKTGSCWIAESAVIAGDVTIGEDASVWPGCVIRGDVAPIRIGARTNVQDGSVLHCKLGVPLEIGEEVAIGHRAVVHCARVGPRSLIGIGAVVLDDAVIGEDCFVAAGALVGPGTIVPPGSLVLGMPARVVRPVRAEERAYIRRVIDGYVELARRHAAGDFSPAR